MVAVVAGVLSLGLLTALAVSQPPSTDTRTSAPIPAGPPPERGDPVLAEQLADQARQTPDTDQQARLRLLLAAHVVATDRAIHRINLAEALLESVQPVNLIRAKLDQAGTIGHADWTASGSFLVTNGTAGGQLWQTEWVGSPPRIRLAGSLGGPVASAAGGGTLERSNVVVAGGDVAVLWRAVALVSPLRLGQLDTHADVVAATADGKTVVAVAASTATVWDASQFEPIAKAALTYDRPVTALAFSPGSQRMLAAGHADGGVTVDAINADSTRSIRRSLNGTGGPVDAVAVSADGSTVAALHQDGTLSVWNLRATSPQLAGTAATAVKPGAHRLWLSDTGDYALLADAVTAPPLWSLADRAKPHPMGTLSVAADPTVPAMTSADGRLVATINAGDILAIWDVKPIVDLLAAPIPQACQLAGLTEQRWRQLVPNPAFTNPCTPPGLPTIGVSHD